MGIGIFSLIIYIVLIFILNMGLKRKMAEALMWAFLTLLVISTTLGGKSAPVMFITGVKTVLSQEVTFGVIAFMVMALLMQETGIMKRLISILNCLFGKIPGGAAYVSTIASALFGMVSGSGSGNSASVGAITIPWMKESGFSDKRATTIVAGNAGLGVVFPPSSSMLLLLGMETIKTDVTSNQLYISMMFVGLVVLLYRLALSYIYVKRDGISGSVPSESFSRTFKKNKSSLLLFLGIIIPLLVQMGPLSSWIQRRISETDGAYKTISLVVWVPVMMIIFVLIEGWRYLPHSFKGWRKLIERSISKCADAGIIIFAIASVGILSRIGMQEEFLTLFGKLQEVSPLIIILAIAVLVTLLAGPFSATAATTAVGAICYSALVSIGVPPVAACVSFLLLVSNEGCVPPNSAPIFIASGIAGLDNPGSIFKDLFLHYAIPVIVISVLIMLRAFPVIGA